MVDGVADLIEAGRLLDGRRRRHRLAELDEQGGAASSIGRGATTTTTATSPTRSCPSCAARPVADSVWATGCSMGALPRRQLLLPPARPVRRPDRDVRAVPADSCSSATTATTTSTSTVRCTTCPNLSDPWHLERYRRSRIIFCVGQGAWEEDAPARHARAAGDPARARASRPRSTTGATTWSITGTGGGRCCATTCRCFGRAETPD